MSDRPTLRTVAAEAGVSHQTVSRVINGDPTVTEPIRDRVLSAMRALGYRPSAGARALASGRTEVVGVVLPHNPGFAFSNDHLIRLVQGADQELTTRGYGLLLSTREVPDDPASAYRRFVQRRQVDGLLVEAGAGGDSLRALRTADYPTVVIGYTAEDFTCVHPDDEGGAYAVAQHLLALGHRRIAVIDGPPESRLAMSARMRGLRRAFADARREVPTDLLEQGDFTAGSGYAAAERLLARADPPTAVFAFNDGMALGAQRRLRERGRDMPGEVSVAGFDDTEAADLVDPSLTSVSLHSVDVGRRAAQILLDLLDGRPPAQRENIMPSTLKVRASTAPPAAG
ncbi:putative LacI family transcriptional regulator [Actinacidiphila reveromycinica]|uniref:Putative LacI family transcriptional regulator n=1 Tax=Actinacidiphila reveromycinica TaxID=659352 RepID=A0A7U3VLM6_9ACTN|nr:LacI family DNA-binding transcriptional regulator [Streptomyces sp. SN-593]BBA95679.1 putative LacI family transcriptional regulator [Streptomyces sp. SN-593]